MILTAPVLLLCLFIQGTPLQVSGYVKYKVNRTKGFHGDKTIEVDPYEGTQLQYVLYGPEDSGRHVAFDCSLVARSSTENGGIVAVIQSMILRMGEDGECIDYITIGQMKDGVWVEGPEICGSMLLITLGSSISGNDLNNLHLRTTSLPEQFESSSYSLKVKPGDVTLSDGAFVDPEGELMIRIHIGEPDDEAVVVPKLYIAFVNYQECDGSLVDNKDNSSKLIHCGLGICIPRIYVGDGVINCPFKDSADDAATILALKNNVAEGYPRLYHPPTQRDPKNRSYKNEL